MKRFQLTLQEDDEGRLYLNLPEDLTEDLSWRPGDHLEYDDEGMVQNYSPQLNCLKSRMESLL